MKEFNLDFDDALTFQIMKANGISDVVSYDRDFDSVPSVRKVSPEDLL